jgi:hypothetical protein
MKSEGGKILMNTVERFTRYLLKVQCDYCPDDVYPHEDDARETVRYWIEYEGIRTIDDLRARVDRTCDGCAHGIEKILND